MCTLHETVGTSAVGGNSNCLRYVVRVHLLPLTAAESVIKDSLLQVSVCHSLRMQF